MATQLGIVIADLDTQTSQKVAAGDTTVTVQSILDDDGVTIHDGVYFFNIDGNASIKEHFVGILTGSTKTLSSIQSISRQGVKTTGFARAHRIGAPVKLTDFATLYILNEIAKGNIALDNTKPLFYDSHPTFTLGTQLVDKTYVDNSIVGLVGTATNTNFGTVKLSVAAASVPNPIVVGDNDPRMISVAIGLGLTTGTSGGAIGSGNHVVDNSDTSTTASASKVVRALGTGLIDPSFIPASAANFIAGATITAGQALHLSPYAQSDGGIILDNQAATAYNNATNQSQAYNVGSGSNRILVASIMAASAPTTVAYNGVVMTLVDSQVITSETLYVYKLAAPTIGSNNIVVTGTGIFGIMIASYFNVSQSVLVEASAKSTTASVNGVSVALTSLSQGAFFHVFAADIHNSGSTSGFSGAFTSRYSTAVSGTVVFAVPGSRSIGSISTSKFNEVQSTTVTPAFTGAGGSGSSSSIAVSLAPATAPGIGVVPTNSSAITVNEPLIDFIGFALSSVALGVSVSTSIGGIITGLSGLTAGKKYYLQDSSGTIGTSRGTYGKVIGYALSSTTLFIDPNKTMGAMMTKVTAYQYTAECDGILTGIGTGAGTLSIVADGFTLTATGTGTSGSNVTMPVSRGKTYTITCNGSPYFTPLA